MYVCRRAGVVCRCARVLNVPGLTQQQHGPVVGPDAMLVHNIGLVLGYHPLHLHVLLY